MAFTISEEMASRLKFIEQLTCGTQTRDDEKHESLKQINSS